MYADNIYMTKCVTHDICQLYEQYSYCTSNQTQG